MGVEPKTGSPAGGTVININGHHFTEDVKAFVSGIVVEL